MNEIETIVRKHALANAVQFSGKASMGAVIGKVIAEKPELKADMDSLKKTVVKIISEVNSLSLEEQKKELEKTGWQKIEKEQRAGLPPLPNAEEGKVVTRFPPFPSGALHIGNMKPAVISYEYAKMYKGKFIVRIEDTDPEKIWKDDAVGLIKKDLKAIGLKYDKFYLCSSQFKKQYRLAKQLLKEGKAYACTCKAVEGARKGKSAVVKEVCEHRNHTIKQNLDLFKKMFAEFKQGDAVIRLKTDINDPNPALRDPVIMRIKDGINPVTGKTHKVYPSYNFNAAVEDHDTGVTHIFRGAEHAFNTEIQKKIFDALGWANYPFTINFGFMYIPGEKVHKRYIREGLKEGKFSGWDDPKLGEYGLVRALIRRGFKPEAMKNMIVEFGVSVQTIHFTWEKLYTENRKLIDKISNRYFFVAEPVEIELDKILTKTVKAPLYPGEKKFRRIPVSKRIFIEKSDFEANKGKEARLMHFCNIVVGKKAKVMGTELKDTPKLHWVPEGSIKASIVMPDGEIVSGLMEPAAEKIKPDQIVQFERVGFARCDRKGLFYFAHK